MAVASPPFSFFGDNMRKTYIYISVLFILVSLLTACQKNRGGPTINVTDPTLPVSTQAVTVNESSTQQTTEEITVDITEPDISVPSETQSVAEDEEIMLVSADPSNPFLNAVVEKYGVSADRLVAFYASSMKTNGNLVYEFDGTTNSSGKMVRNTSTLKNIYTVDENLVAKKATGTPEEGNEYSKKDSLYCEYFSKWVVFKVYGKAIQDA